MKKALVIINEQHSLLPEQEKILSDKYNYLLPRVEVEDGYDNYKYADAYEDVVCRGWELLEVPAEGWSITEMKEKVEEIYNIAKKEREMTIIFVSPVPFVLKELAEISGGRENSDIDFMEILVFHNDNRKKKELPNGKIISVVANKGWQLV